MKVVLALLLACIVYAAESVEYCGSLPSCGEGQCCSGGFYHRYCRRYAEDGEPCERPNSAENYSVSCPCKEGLVCSAIFRCQKE